MLEKNKEHTTGLDFFVLFYALEFQMNYHLRNCEDWMKNVKERFGIQSSVGKGRTGLNMK